MVAIYCNQFNPNQIANSGQCFRWHCKGDNQYDIVAFGKVLTVTQADNMLWLDCTHEEFDTIWYDYFDLDTDYPEVTESQDKFLVDAYRYGSGIRILRQNIWETIVSFIISQRKSIPAIKTSIERLCKTYGDKIEGTEYYSFPSPSQLIDLSKDDCGLGYRLEYIQTLAQKVVNGEFDVIKLIAADYDEVKQMLLSVRGIGEKVANCILLFGLGFTQACPIDVWMQKVIDEEYGGVVPDWMNAPCAGVLQQYVFYYKRNMR